jgi:hypothetical protein
VLLAVLAQPPKDEAVNIEIKSWRDGRVLYSGEHESLRRAVEEAVSQNVNLVGADLQGADLKGTHGHRAQLVYANLRDANLRDADLREADLRAADLSGADLHAADLHRTNIIGADLRGAKLVGTDLRNAEAAREDVRRLISVAPAEAPGLLSALRDGRVNGSSYAGPCACLCGTIAKIRAGNVLWNHEDVMEVLDSAPIANSSRPAERWALAIQRGDTPETSPVVALTVQWIEEWLAEWKHVQT